MARQIEKNSDYKSALLKFIPSEIIAAYLFIRGIIGDSIIFNDVNIYRETIWVVFIILVIGSPLYLKKVMNVENRLQQWLISASFIVWVYTLGEPGPFSGYYSAKVASIIMVLWTFFLPVFKEKASA